LSHSFTDSSEPNQPDQPDNPPSNWPDETFEPLPDTTPLPDFETGNPELPATKSSSAAPQKLDRFLAAQRLDEETTPSISSMPTPMYRVSPAEPNLPGHVLPPESEPAIQEAEAGSTWKTAWAITREVGETIILTLIIFFLIQFFIRNFRVVGTSMVNNLHDGQYLIIDKVSYNPYLVEYLGVGGPKRGDVVVFKPPRNPNEDYVKRIIALPGETVQVIRGQVYINDELLAEPFQPTPGSYTMPAPITVPDDQIFVLGDNRNNSNDSHNWGPLPVENIVGRAWLSYWPPSMWGTIPRNAPTDEATLSHFLHQFTPSANAHNE
jgi:signal peptidase I